jgi:hypothetical protein
MDRPGSGVFLILRSFEFPSTSRQELHAYVVARGLCAIQPVFNVAPAAESENQGLAQNVHFDRFV